MGSGRSPVSSCPRQRRQSSLLSASAVGAPPLTAGSRMGATLHAPRSFVCECAGAPFVRHGGGAERYPRVHYVGDGQVGGVLRINFTRRPHAQSVCTPSHPHWTTATQSYCRVLPLLPGVSLSRRPLTSGCGAPHTTCLGISLPKRGCMNPSRTTPSICSQVSCQWCQRGKTRRAVRSGTTKLEVTAGRPPPTPPQSRAVPILPPLRPMSMCREGVPFPSKGTGVDESGRKSSADQPRSLPSLRPLVYAPHCLIVRHGQPSTVHGHERCLLESAVGGCNGQWGTQRVHPCTR